MSTNLGADAKVDNQGFEKVMVSKERYFKDFFSNIFNLLLIYLYKLLKIN